jgi:hypothetical protein
MGKELKTIQTNFSAGQWSATMRGRVDLAKYYNSAPEVTNFVVRPEGGAFRRTGTYFVHEVKDSSDAGRLIPFTYSITQAYQLEFGDLYFRIYKDRAPVYDLTPAITGATAANPVVITSAAHGLSNGDQVDISGVFGMTQLNGRMFTVANVAANTFELSGIDGTAYTAYTSGGTASRIYTVTTPWTAAQLRDLKFAQSADVLYIAHPSYAPRQITRTSDTAWTVAEYDFQDGPYLDINTTATTFTLSAHTVGAGRTLTASANTFATTDVGRVFRTFPGGSTVWGYGKITAYTDPQNVTVTLIEAPTGAAIATTNWRLGAWSDTTGWPSVVTLFQQRILWAASNTLPQTVWGSVTGQLNNMQPTQPDGSVTDSDGFTFTIADDQVNAIRWMSSGKNAVGIGTSDGEYNMYGSSSSGILVGITPSNVQISRETDHGSVSNVRPQRIGGEVIFVQRSRRRVRAATYNYANPEGTIADDVTLTSLDALGTGVLDFAYQEEIDHIGWFVRLDGKLAAFTYDKGQNINGWHVHELGGSAVVESVSVLPSPNAEEGDDVWLLVNRTINGGTKRYIEYISPRFNADVNGQNSMFYVDSGLTYDGYLGANITLSALTGVGVTVTASTAVFDSSMVGRQIHSGASVATITAYTDTTHVTVTVVTDFTDLTIDEGDWSVARQTFTGLWHLEGQAVSVCVDGAAHNDVTVSSGSITLDSFYSKVHAGLGYVSRLKMWPPELPELQTVQGMTQVVYECATYFYQSLGGQFGYVRDDGTESFQNIYFRAPNDPLGEASPLFTGIKKLYLSGGYKEEPFTIFRQSQPLPMNLLFVVRKGEYNE